MPDNVQTQVALFQRFLSGHEWMGMQSWPASPAFLFKVRAPVRSTDTVSNFWRLTRPMGNDVNELANMNFDIMDISGIVVQPHSIIVYKGFCPFFTFSLSLSLYLSIYHLIPMSLTS